MTFALTDTISAILGQPIRSTRKDALVRCPFHDDRHASLSINQETGFWICFACGVRGGIQSLATRMGVTLNDADLALKVYEGNQSYVFEEPKDFAVLAKELRSKLYTARPSVVADFITKRQLSPRVLRHFGLGWDGQRIAFPFYDEEFVHGIKYRDASGHKTMEEGSKVDGLYNVNDIRFKPYVIVCEGESDTLAVWSALTEGYVSDIVDHVGVCGAAGVAANKTTWDIRALDFLWAKKVFVAFDADAAGDEGAFLPLAAVGDKGIRMRPTLGKDMTEHLVAGGFLHDFEELAGAFRLLVPSLDTSEPAGMGAISSGV